MARTSKSRRENPDGSMPLTGHLRELRNRVLLCLLALGGGLSGLFEPGAEAGDAVHGHGRGLRLHLRLHRAPGAVDGVPGPGAGGGLAAAFPFIAYHVYAFCGPGLRVRERGFLLGALGFGTLCFCAGVLFAYFLSVPFMLRFLIQFSVEVDVSAAISIQQYVNFLTTVFLIFGAVFELPVISVLLTALGVLKAEWMAKGRKVVIVLIFFLAAVITPPDVVSQIMVAIPMIGLYELSILLSRLFSRARRGRSQRL